MSANTPKHTDSQMVINDAEIVSEENSGSQEKALGRLLKAESKLSQKTSTQESLYLAQDDNVSAGDIKISDNSTKTIGLLVILLVFVGFGGWAMFAPLDSAALASGVVKVKSNRKTVQHLEGGIVKELLVRDGDHVKVGDTLLIIDQTQARAELGILTSQLITAQATVARLTAERERKEEATYPFVNIEDPRVQQVIATENQQFQARRQSIEGETSVLEQRIGQLNNQVKGLLALISSKRRLVKSYEEEIRDNEALLSEGFVNKQRLRDVQRSRDSLLGELSEHRSNIDAIKVQVIETKLQILQVNKNFRTEVIDQLSQAQANVYDLQERTTAISDRVKRTAIKAPSDGMIIDLKVYTVGGVIAPGTPILDIVPEGEELVIEAEVSTTDIDNISIGMAADIRFSAFKSGTTPVIDGVVTHLSADSLLNEATGLPYYLARVKVADVGMEKLGGLQLLPGMPAEVLINTGARTLLEYLVQPATDAIARSMIEE